MIGLQYFLTLSVYLCQSKDSFYLLVCLSEVTSSLHWSACTCIESFTLVPTLVMPEIITLPYCYSRVKGNNRAGLSSVLINASNSTALWWEAEDLYGTLSNTLSQDLTLGPSALGATRLKPSQQSTLSEIKLLTWLGGESGKGRPALTVW